MAEQFTAVQKNQLRGYTRGLSAALSANDCDELRRLGSSFYRNMTWLLPPSPEQIVFGAAAGGEVDNSAIEAQSESDLGKTTLTDELIALDNQGKE